PGRRPRRRPGEGRGRPPPAPVRNFGHPVGAWSPDHAPTGDRASPGRGHHHGGPPAPALDPHPALDGLEHDMARPFAGWVVLRRKDRADLVESGGELDRVMQMPGWTNVWTRPIQNRVDMLATGVSTTVGVRVLGRRLEDVVRASEEIAAVLKRVPG